MLRRAALVLASVLVCGCQYPGQPVGTASPFGVSRIPPPGTNSYPKPDVYYPPGSNPGAAAPASTAPGSLAPNSLFNSKPAGVAPAGTTSSWQVEDTQPAVRFGDSRAPAASSSIRLNGMPVNDATRPPLARSTPAAGYPEITDLPRGNSYGAQPAGYFAPTVLPSGAPYGVGSSPAYAPGSIGATSANSGSLGWRVRGSESGNSGTLR